MNYSGGWALRKHKFESTVTFSSQFLHKSARLCQFLSSCLFAHSYTLLKQNPILVVSIPCAFIVVVVDRESVLCFLLTNFMEDREIHGLVADLVSGIFVAAKNLPYTSPSTSLDPPIPPGHCQFLMSFRNSEMTTLTVSFLEKEIFFFKICNVKFTKM